LTYVLFELVAAVALVSHEELDLVVHYFTRLVLGVKEAPAQLAVHPIANPLEPVLTGPGMRKCDLFHRMKRSHP
jgi:hypothetical protein